MSIPLWEECSWLCNIPKSTTSIQQIEPTNNNSNDPLLASPSSSSGSATFPLDLQLARKIYLHLGQGYKIPADCLVIGQNEQLNDRTDDNLAVFTLAGPVMEQDLAELAPIQTGESTLTTGGALPFDWVVHAVGPRYDERFLTAADQALHSAYRNALALAAEKKVKDIVITCIYSKRKKYPRFDAAHIALRTIRKFFQHPVSSCFQRVMFCVPDQDDYEIYSALLSAYFPRSMEEVYNQSNLLPKELGDEWGQLVLMDRQLNISAGPQPLTKEDLEEYRKAGDVYEDDEPLKAKKLGKSILSVTFCVSVFNAETFKATSKLLM